MSVFDMLKNRNKKETKQEETKETDKGSKTPPSEKQGMKYDQSYFEKTLSKYLVDDEIVKTVLPAFMKLSENDPEGKLVDMLTDVLEFKEQEIQSFYDNEEKFKKESDDDVKTPSDDKGNEEEDYLMQVLNSRYGDK